MSSREIAELTGKQHKHVLTDIREMLETLGIAAADFSATAQVKGPNNSKRTIKIFNLPKRETLILVSGYDMTAALPPANLYRRSSSLKGH